MPRTSSGSPGAHGLSSPHGPSTRPAVQSTQLLLLLSPDLLGPPFQIKLTPDPRTPTRGLSLGPPPALHLLCNKLAVPLASVGGGGRLCCPLLPGVSVGREVRGTARLSGIWRHRHEGPFHSEGRAGQGQKGPQKGHLWRWAQTQPICPESPEQSMPWGRVNCPSVPARDPPGAGGQGECDRPVTGPQAPQRKRKKRTEMPLLEEAACWRGGGRGWGETEVLHRMHTHCPDAHTHPLSGTNSASQGAPPPSTGESSRCPWAWLGASPATAAQSSCRKNSFHSKTTKNSVRPGSGSSAESPWHVQTACCFPFLQVTAGHLSHCMSTEAGLSCHRAICFRSGLSTGRLGPVCKLTVQSRPSAESPGGLFSRKIWGNWCKYFH